MNDLKESVIALYDVSAIQDFIFSSNKVKENIGASNIVYKVLSEFLPESIKKVCDNLNKNYLSESEPEFLTNRELKSEIIFIGGGNALIWYDSSDTYKSVNKELSKSILENSGGFLTVNSAPVKFTENFSYDYSLLIKKLTKNKNYKVNTKPNLGFPITKPGITDGLPAVTKSSQNEYISLPAAKKTKYFKQDNFKIIFKDLVEQGYEFTNSFDDLGQQKGEDFIAVIHIDGNNIGSEIFNKVTEIKDYKEAVFNLRKISIKLTGIFKDTAQYVLDKVKDLNADRIIPVRPIILNGDDATFVCKGKLGLEFARLFLEKISDNKISFQGKELNITACAGVCICKSHFPFFRAYKLAEELTANAKLKNKILSEMQSEKSGSWLDYHIVMSGISGSLSHIREKSYNVLSMDKATSISYKGLETKEYNLLWRPFCITGDFDEKYSFKSILKLITSAKNIPRSRIKQMRSAFIKSKSEVVKLNKELSSRRYKILKKYPGIMEEYIFNEKNKTPYFEIFELSEYYKTLENLKKGDKNEN